MGMDLDNLQLKQAQEPTQEELLAEAKAWGFATVEEFFAAMGVVYEKLNLAPTYSEALENLKGSITSFKEFLAKPIE